MRRLTVLKWLAGLLLLQCLAYATPSTGLQPCRVEGMPNELLCGSVSRPLDPDRPDGVRIDVHYLVVPAMARNKQADPVVMLAGGPGQSAISVAPAVLNRLGRLNNRRDLVFIDQRGTGRSAPLQCDDDSHLSLAQSMDMAAQLARLQTCKEKLSKLPYGDMRFFTTTIAMQDFDAVRKALGATQWNLIGGSYGTRAALEYLRQFPDHVRRTVLDGVAPPDQVLPISMSADTQTALDAEFSACEKEVACRRLYPALRAQWDGLLKGLPRAVVVRHPVTGDVVTVTHIRVSEVEAIEDLEGIDEDRTRFDVGYGLCFGHNERKAIAMANLDIACHRDAGNTQLEQSLLLTTDALDSAGFLEHLKLPHYVTFRSMIERKLAVRKMRNNEASAHDGA